MEEWFLFDRIALYSAHITPRNIKRAAAVIADLANTRLSFGDRTAMPAGKTSHPAEVQLLVEIAFPHSLVEHVS